MARFEQFPYYDWDDEGEEVQLYDQDYYQRNLLNRHQIQEQHLYQNDDQMYANSYQPRLSSDDENISPSSNEDRMVRLPQNNGYNESYQQLNNKKVNKQSNYVPNSNRNQYYTDQNLEVNDDNELLTITVEIGNGEKENIVIRDNDTPEEVAHRFWQKYELNDELKTIFTEQIAQNIEQVKRELESDKQSISDGYRDEQISTAFDINTTPAKHSFPTYEEYKNQKVPKRAQPPSRPQNFSTLLPNKSSVPSLPSFSVLEQTPPGPILINPYKNDKLTLTK